VSGPTRRRKAKCHRQCHEIDRHHARARCCCRHGKGRHILAALAPQRAVVRGRRRSRSSRTVWLRPLPLNAAVTTVLQVPAMPRPLSPAAEPILQRCPAEPRRNGQPFKVSVRTRSLRFQPLQHRFCSSQTDSSASTPFDRQRHSIRLRCYKLPPIFPSTIAY